jgi:hypothetical protein
MLRKDTTASVNQEIIWFSPLAIIRINIEETLGTDELCHDYIYEVRDRLIGYGID